MILLMIAGYVASAAIFYGYIIMTARYEIEPTAAKAAKPDWTVVIDESYRKAA